MVSGGVRIVTTSLVDPLGWPTAPAMDELRRFGRWPAALWVCVFAGSELILNGAHGNRDAWQVAVGLGLVSAAFVVGVYLAVNRWPHGRPAVVSWSLGGVALFYVACAVAAGLAGGAGYAVAALLAGLIPGTAVALVLATARRKTQTSPAETRDSSVTDGDDSEPGIGLDDETPLGATPEAHDDLSPHDLPRDHPSRKALNRR
jgi:hypothetical protein